ncbi:MAG TPA: maleylpyruvate isomerase N-terminal domain-containing protein [Candidatus Limnocylindrales bacterium]
MSNWDATNFSARDNLLRVVDRQAQELFTMAAAPGVWEAPTACSNWQVRDIVGHLIDVTEGYFTGFDAARSGAQVPDALGTKAMQDKLNEAAQGLRSLGQDAALARLRDDYTKLVGIVEGLAPDEWAGLMVPHKYMGTLPAFFYPVFQLMDYSVHGWDIRQGSGRAHCFDGEAADMLVPFMFILWSATADIPADAEPCEIGIKVNGGNNAGSWRITAGPAGIAYTPGEVDEVGDPATAPGTGTGTVLEFDPGSFVLTAFGRSNAGTVRGDAALADRYLNMFFRI